MCAHGRAGQAQLPFWRRISQSEIRNSAAAEKSESESEGGQKTCPELVEGFLPPNPLPFCPPERSVSAVPPTAGVIIQSFARKRFELRSVIAPKLCFVGLEGIEPSVSSSRTMRVAGTPQPAFAKIIYLLSFRNLPCFFSSSSPLLSNSLSQF
ncbi:MAG: hypothetical protein CEN90_436 [Parcubacteria group bacterium Licking1014_17]|nr:MAG: hypothetical protein CEN90_436 [Parcubacteria group bacterium Licking1014_17]